MTCSNVNAADLGVPGEGDSLSPFSSFYLEKGDKQSHCASTQKGWQSKLASCLNLDRRKVNDVLLGKRTSARIAAAITGATGMSASQLWPGKYPRLEYAERVMRAKTEASGRPE